MGPEWDRVMRRQCLASVFLGLLLSAVGVLVLTLAGSGLGAWFAAGGMMASILGTICYFHYDGKVKASDRARRDLMP